VHVAAGLADLRLAEDPVLGFNENGLIDPTNFKGYEPPAEARRTKARALTTANATGFKGHVPPEEDHVRRGKAPGVFAEGTRETQKAA